MTHLRAAFPLLDRVAYLNAGTDGPVPEAARRAARAAIDAQTDEGRVYAHFEARAAGQDALRAAYAARLGARPADVALTTSTSEGLGKVLSGLRLSPGDEILTSDEEHPGLIGPLITQARFGVRVRTAPLDALAAAVTRETTAVACSHVGWVSGRRADPALAEVDVPVIYDGAQGLGAVAVDVAELGCAAYAASGQKWLCGADGTGMLYLAPWFADEVAPLSPGYMAFESTLPGQEHLHADARRHDTASLSREGVDFSLAALDVLAAAGWEAVLRDGPRRAAALAAALAERGHVVAPRDETTLVSWEDPDPPATRARLFERGVVVRDLPGTSYLRASVGAWNDEGDLERLLEGLYR